MQTRTSSTQTRGLAARMLVCCAFVAISLVPVIAGAYEHLAVVKQGVDVDGQVVQLSGTVDSNRDGRKEVLIGGRFQFSLVQDDPSPRAYREVARVSRDEDFLGAVLANIDGETNLLVHWSNSIELFDLHTLQSKARYAPTYYGGMGVGDVDGDGHLDVVLGTEWTITLFDAATLAWKAEASLHAGYLAVANVTGDSRDEVIADDGRAYTFTRVGGNYSATEVWSTPVGTTGFAMLPSPVDIDGDGYSEIVLRDTYSGQLTLHTVSPIAASRPLETIRPVQSMVFTDVNGDSHPDFVLSDGHQSIRATSLTTGKTLWDRQIMFGSADSIAVEDITGDGVPDIVWSERFNGESRLYADTIAPSAKPRWRTFHSYEEARGWTFVRHADGSQSMAVLSGSVSASPGLSTLSFLDSVTLADQGGTDDSWLSGVLPYSARQMDVAAVHVNGTNADRIVLGGSIRSELDGSLSPRFWIMSDVGALLETRTPNTLVSPQKIVASSVLDRPEQQIVMVGFKTLGTGEQAVQAQVLDLASGNVLWQSAMLPTVGGPISQLEVQDMNGDGRPEVLVGYGSSLTVFTPGSGTDVVASYPANTFSALDRGHGATAKLATAQGSTVSVFDGLTATPEKQLILTSQPLAVALFLQAPNDELMLATNDYGGPAVTRWADGQRVGDLGPSLAVQVLKAVDLDHDHRVELIGTWPGFLGLRFDNDYIFRSSVE